MYKLPFKITCFILLFSFVVFSSCEGRTTARKALSEDVEEFTKKINFQTDVYIPEDYMEREVDTLMHNGYRVKIKTFADMDNSVLFTKLKDTINYQTYYRNYKFNITVEKEGKVIYDKSFDKKKANTSFGFKKNLIAGSDLYAFDKLSVLKSIEVDDNPSNTNFVAINLIYFIPETDKASYHQIRINDKGKANFIQTEKP